MHDVMVSPGACSETCAIFLGRVDTTNAGGVFGLESEGENILVKVLPFVEARAMLERDEIDNAARRDRAAVAGAASRRGAGALS